MKVIATRFINTLTQEAEVFEFLPVGEIKGCKIPGAESEAESPPIRASTCLSPTRRRCSDIFSASISIFTSIRYC